ncbi:MAG: segregation/condensation protein A [Bacteroides sp.]|nr:segregation/condensation protein A [Eubacterium sp.]MCM1419015.1 segregation/condensation protein A [Roseburia sp.]MCM1462863.1 segregation/condensation protein A [Bacteroides sp.]
MEELQFKLKIYEGPLDLMLDLIRKHKLNIRDIEISVLLEQFLLYLDNMREADMEIAGEFVEMAAHLILMKTASLLPKHEIEEMKRELSGRLIEYALCKEVARRLKRRFIGDLQFVRDPLEIPIDPTYHNLHDAYELTDCFAAVSGRSEKLKKEARLALKPLVAQSYVSVFTKVVYVLKRIRGGEPIGVKSLYRGQTRSEQVATFLALLELSKHSRVLFSDDGETLVMASGKEKGTNETE